MFTELGGDPSRRLPGRDRAPQKRPRPGGYLPEEYPLAIYGRDRAVLPPQATVLAEDTQGEPALWQLGANAFGFSAPSRTRSCRS